MMGHLPSVLTTGLPEDAPWRRGIECPPNPHPTLILASPADTHVSCLSMTAYVQHPAQHPRVFIWDQEVGMLDLTPGRWGRCSSGPSSWGLGRKALSHTWNPYSGHTPATVQP